MTRTPAIANLIRDGKIHQLYSTMQTSAQFGMKLMDAALAEVCKQGLVSFDTAFEYAVDQDAFRKMS
jgi:twitching motility protein PilT